MAHGTPAVLQRVQYEQIVRELIAESAILVAVGLACSFFLTNAADGSVLAILSQAYSGFALTVNHDSRVWLFTAGAALTALSLFGIISARRTSAVTPIDVLKSGSLSAYSAQGRTRRILICGQVVFMRVLVIGAGVFVATLRQVRGESMGFQMNSVLDVQFDAIAGRLCAWI